jgi:hypothetical protein
MNVEPLADQTKRSAPLGSAPVPSILSPKGELVLLLMPRYRLVKAPAVPLHE